MAGYGIGTRDLALLGRRADRHPSPLSLYAGLEAGIVISAGLVLAATFGILASLPLVFLVELGFTVALGVILDTIIVRSVLVTAINLDVGGRIWWPSNLDRDDRGTAVEQHSPPQRADVPIDA